ncbi:hypothetical protein Pcinc_025983 [Petrolisthes cinctipes]|uniref:Cytochrome b-c1 complex subunit 6 n=1 Tax=Petrolisthes cinctipes TaxID=88211 RepID=A0AAE1K8P1_PETCI|nr:hypothetical protein Pcinc_025983 [Petrolisthes cinctipes]
MAIDDVVVHNDDPEEEEEEEEEEDLVDPFDGMKEACGTGHCSGLGEKLNTCNDRVNSRSSTEETCSEELFDYLHCIDHCLTKSLFTKLK